MNPEVLMSLPRMIRAGSYWMLTRRTLNRMFLLRPEPWVRSLFAYALARACAESGVEVVGGCVTSNHYHLIVFDPVAQVPKFARLLDELVARAANAERERNDYFWESKGLKYTALPTREAVEQELVYALTNPQKDGLVHRSSAWQGWLSLPEMLGTTRTVTRPELRFFTARTTLPESFELRLAVPGTHAEMDGAEFRAHIAARMCRREQALDEERAGKPCLGMARVLAFEATGSPRADEPWVSPIPVAAAGRMEHAGEALAEYREALRAFVALYRAAYRALRAGAAYCFPWGTYHWRVFANLRVAEESATG